MRLKAGPAGQGSGRREAAGRKRIGGRRESPGAARAGGAGRAPAPEKEAAREARSAPGLEAGRVAPGGFSGCCRGTAGPTPGRAAAASPPHRNGSGGRCRPPTTGTRPAGRGHPTAPGRSRPPHRLAQHVADQPRRPGAGQAAGITAGRTSTARLCRRPQGPHRGDGGDSLGNDGRIGRIRARTSTRLQKTLHACIH